MFTKFCLHRLRNNSDLTSYFTMAVNILQRTSRQFKNRDYNFYNTQVIFPLLHSCYLRKECSIVFLCFRKTRCITYTSKTIYCPYKILANKFSKRYGISKVHFFLFSLSSSFRMWAITGLHNFPSLVTLRTFAAFPGISQFVLTFIHIISSERGDTTSPPVTCDFTMSWEC